MTRSLRLWHYLTRYIDGVLLSGILLLMLTGLVHFVQRHGRKPKSCH